jgi:hypothetical protein
MNVIDPGRSYELNAGIVLQFIETDGGTKIRDGTTIEEVLAALIHRVTEAYQVVPCRETVHALYLLHEALMRFRMRTARRVSAKVEGTNQLHDSEIDIDRFTLLTGVMRTELDGSRAPFEELPESQCA